MKRNTLKQLERKPRPLTIPQMYHNQTNSRLPHSIKKIEDSGIVSSVCQEITVNQEL